MLATQRRRNMSLVRPKSVGANLVRASCATLAADVESVVQVARTCLQTAIDLGGLVDSLVGDEVFFRGLERHFLEQETRRSKLILRGNLI